MRMTFFGGIDVTPVPTRCTSSAVCISLSRFEESLLALPSTATPTRTPASSRAGTWQMPEPSRRLLTGQCATPQFIFPSRWISSGVNQMPCAYHTSGPTHPTLSMYSKGRIPSFCTQKSCSSFVSHRCVCMKTFFSRAKTAVSARDSFVTENGEHGASTRRVIANGLGSWYFAISRSQSARMASQLWVTSSGGRPPCERPRLMLPRVGWKRTPIRRASSISTSRNSCGAERGNT